MTKTLHNIAHTCKRCGKLFRADAEFETAQEEEDYFLLEINHVFDNSIKGKLCMECRQNEDLGDFLVQS